MKTSPKTSVALLAVLALGGSTAGSLFSESLQTNVIGTIGTAGSFFPDGVIQIPVQQVVATPDTKSDSEEVVIALPVLVVTLIPVSDAQTQVRAITAPEIAPSQTPIPGPTPIATPSDSPEPTIAPDLSPEVSASQTPEPEPSELISVLE
jgi:hypothetical protein